MGGVVRRFMGSYHIPNPHKGSGKCAGRVEVQKKSSKSELDPQSTEAIAQQLLDPTVSEDEIAEYQGYIDQCQDLLVGPIDGGERKDLEVYQFAVRTALGETFDILDEAPDEAFLTYLGQGVITHLHDGGRKDSTAGHFNYERWLGSAGQRLT